MISFRVSMLLHSGLVVKFYSLYSVLFMPLFFFLFTPVFMQCMFDPPTQIFSNHHIPFLGSSKAVKLPEILGQVGRIWTFSWVSFSAIELLSRTNSMCFMSCISLYLQTQLQFLPRGIHWIHFPAHTVRERFWTTLSL